MKCARVVFILKAIRRDPFCAEDHRVRTGHPLKMLMKRLTFSKSQHGLLKSTETYLHEEISIIERSLQYKQNTSAAFLDIE